MRTYDDMAGAIRPPAGQGTRLDALVKGVTGAVELGAEVLVDREGDNTRL
jgi:hypothetical protein